MPTRHSKIWELEGSRGKRIGKSGKGFGGNFEKWYSLKKTKKTMMKRDRKGDHL